MDITAPNISPFLFCHDVAKSRQFLVDAFGMTVDGGTTDEVALLRLGAQTVFLARSHPGEMEPADTMERRHSLVMMYVEQVDEVFRRATAAGAEVVYEPQDMPYGQRECGVKDIDGQLWSIATTLPS